MLQLGDDYRDLAIIRGQCTQFSPQRFNLAENSQTFGVFKVLAQLLPGSFRCDTTQCHQIPRIKLELEHCGIMDRLFEGFADVSRSPVGCLGKGA
ncbi:hypothetical protein HMPREF2967_03175 [Corynebacterium sp. HMSC059E07]|nr:hypothetical protein HMPREF2967_03175 [Corynebacterium sp. HMSC059E07]